MARKITRLSLEELEKEIPAIPQSEQEKCLGGYKGSEYSPYSREEYLRSLASGSWEGGFVSMTEVEIAEYRNNTSQGLMYSAWTPNTIYIERHIVLDEFTVTAPAPTGNYADEAFQRMRERYGIYDGSGFWGVVDPITGFSGAYGGGGEGGGTTQQSNRVIVDARGAIPKFIGYDDDDRTGCLRRCLDMLGYKNNRIAAIRNIQMVSDRGDGYAGKSTAEFQQGLDLIESHLRQKRPVVVGIDYEVRGEGERINEGITDHYVVIVSKETRLIDGKETEVYRYYDPITSSHKYGTHKDNYLILEGNKLVGIYKHHPRKKNLPYTVTQVREYKKP